MFSWLESHMLPCMYRQLFGIDCPICGTQRSLLAALRGDFAASFSIYPPLLPVLGLIIVSLLWLVNRKMISRKFLVNYSLFTLVLVMTNYIFKLIHPQH